MVCIVIYIFYVLSYTCNTPVLPLWPASEFILQPKYKNFAEQNVNLLEVCKRTWIFVSK